VENTQTIYKVPERNLSLLQARIAKLAKRATKLHSEPIALNVLGYTDHKREATEFRLAQIVRIYDVTVSGPAPRINGWEFIAVLEPIASESGEVLGNLLRNVPNASKPLPESYRTAGNHCDHCNAARRRNETFVLANESGDYKQVGRQCLRDFLGHASPEMYANLAQILLDCAAMCSDSEDEDWGGGGGRGASRYITEEVLTLAACSIRLEGWRSATAARERGGESTSGAVACWIDASAESQKKWKNPLHASGGDRETAKAVCEWLSTLESRAELNDYFYNLSLLGQGATITCKSFGLACSAIPTYLREMEREINRRKRMEEDSNSVYVGEVGTRIKITATLVHTTDLESDFGVTHLYKFKDESGNVLMWFASSIYWNPLTGQDIAMGDTIVLDASIKKHEEYKGIKQTMITRAKAWVSPEEKKAAAKTRKAERVAEQKFHDANIAANPNFYDPYHPDYGKLSTEGEKAIQEPIQSVGMVL
jgi:hypothetical protein